MSNSVRPHRRQPTRLPCPWDPPGKNTGVGCHFLLQCMKVKSESEVDQLCPTLSNPMDCSPPGSSVHGIFQARVLEWGAIAFSAYIYVCLYIYFLIFPIIVYHKILNIVPCAIQYDLLPDDSIIICQVSQPWRALLPNVLAAFFFFPIPCCHSGS